MVDCLARTTHCTREAFEELAKSELGGLTEEDRSALQTWKELRRLYQGRVEKAGDGDPGLPLPHSQRQIERRVRLAGYLASTPSEYAANVGMLIDNADADRARAVLDRFTERFERYWRRAEPELTRLVASFARAMQAPGLVALVDRITTFYGPDLPVGSELTFDLVLRPRSDGSHAEQLAHVSMVEVTTGEAPEERLDVVLHELFHYFLSQVETAKLEALVKRFATSEDRTAYAAYGLLDESLASAFGNGLVLKTLAPKTFERRFARPHGLYTDDLIDLAAKAAVPRLEEALARGPALSDPGFFDLWLETVRAAFPDGIPPRALLRPFACVYPEELEAAMDDFYEVAAQSASAASLDPKEVGDLFDRRPHWTRVFLLRKTDVPTLARWAPVIPPSVLKAVRQLSQQADSFAWVDLPKGQPALIVFVAEGDAAMKELFARFRSSKRLVAGHL